MSLGCVIVGNFFFVDVFNSSFHSKHALLLTIREKKVISKKLQVDL